MKLIIKIKNVLAILSFPPFYKCSWLFWPQFFYYMNFLYHFEKCKKKFLILVNQEPATNSSLLPIFKNFCNYIWLAKLYDRIYSIIIRWLFWNTLEKLDYVLLSSKVLSNADQLVFYFMKLKESLDFTILAFIFDCDVKELEEIFTNILNAHHR